MSQPFDREALWAKAKVFINRAFDSSEAGDFPQAAMWAALALELLGKSALSRVNPCLIADPNDDGLSLMIAAGLSHDHSRAKSIPAKAVMSRCERAFQPFSSKEAARITQARNEELHSGLLPFDGIADQKGWWQRYWVQAEILIEAQGETTTSFVGSKRATIVQDHLDANAEYVKRQTALMITKAATHWASISQNPSPRGLRRLTLLAEFSADQTCPACKQQGLLQGDDVAHSDVDFDPEGPGGSEQLDVYSDSFECPSCGLFLVGQQYLTEAGLPDTFAAEREYEPDFDEYGND